jgi:DtxR family Mn-dependent transcriptional regulator
MTQGERTTSTRWEQYIETIDGVQRRKGYAKVKDVADHLDVGLPTVTEMFGKLAEAGLINYEKYSGVTLTEKGQDMANDLSNKHDTLRSFLSILGVPEDVADADACIMEHNVSTETLDRLTTFVEFVNLPKEGPVYLMHFREYYETGDTPRCARDCLMACVEDSKELMERLDGSSDPDAE